MAALLRQALVGGIDHSNPADGGEECISSVPMEVRLALSIPSLIAAYFCWRYSLPRAKQATKEDELNVDFDDTGIVSRLVRYSAAMVQLSILLAQCYYKMNSGTLAFMIMPCHLTGFVQVYLLLVRDLTTFRVHIHSGVIGAMLALATPELSTLTQPYEVEVFMAEHWIVVALPIFFVLFGRYTIEHLSIGVYLPVAWSIVVVIFTGVFQTLSVLTWGNFNLMGCAAGSTPELFYNGIPLYQFIGFLHQTFATFCIGKLYSFTFLTPPTMLRALFVDSKSKKA